MYMQLISTELLAKMKAAVFIAAASAAMSVSAEVPGSILRNAGFEESGKGKPVAWSLPPYYSLAPGMGRNGTAAIAYSFETNRKMIAPVAQKIVLEPTETYRVSCWIRTEGVKPPKREMGARIGIEWKDGAGRCDGAYSRQLVGTHDWTHVSIITPQMPHDLKSCRVQIYVGYGKTPGKAWFDDVWIEKIEAKPISGLYSGAYRGTCWGDEPVRFAAHVNISARAISNGAAKVSLSYRDKSGAARTVSPSRLAPDRAEFSLRASELEMGSQSVVCSVTTNGVLAGDASCRIVRVKSDPGWRVRFDRHGRALVDGRPFFPLGMFMGKVTENELAVYCEGPFNCAMPYQEPPREMLDLCESRGLKVIYPLKDVYSHTKWAKAHGIGTEEAANEYVASRVGEFKSHNAILAWYLCDEMGPDHASLLGRRRALFERLDPDHPTWTCLLQVNQLSLYMDSIDCVGTDPYPVAKGAISRAADWTMMTKRNTAGSRPIWMVPQAFSWTWFPLGREGDRMPTENEMRAMSWQMIACGANGLIYYAFHQMRRNCGEDFPRDWAAVKIVASEVARHADVLMSEPGPAVKSDVHESFLPVRTWRRGGEAFVLAVNATPKQVAAKAVVEGSWKTCSTMFGSPANLVDGGTVSVDVPPWGVSLSRLTQGENASNCEERR